MAHKTEEFMVAALATLSAAMASSTVAVIRDDSYDPDVNLTERINLTQGDDVILSQNFKYTDTLLTINIDIFVGQQATASPVGTLINARRAAVVQAFAPTTQGADSLGVTGAYELQEGDSFPPVPDHTDRPVADMRMLWNVKLRRQVDDPETFP